jgi:transposase
MCKKKDTEQLKTKITASAKQIDDLTFEDIEFLKDLVKNQLPEEFADKIVALIDLATSTREAFEKNRQTLISLLKNLFGPKTEQVLKNPKKINKDKKPNKGHGPNSPDEQPVAEEIHVEIDEKELKVGDKCPDCGNKNIVKSVETSFLRFLGRLPLLLKKYVFHNLRCSLCGKVFRPQAPEDMGDEKYDSATRAMLTQLIFEAAIPSYRLEKLFKSWGLKLSDSTMWDIVEKVGEILKPVYEELKNQIAQSENIYSDDTGSKVLEKPERKKSSQKQSSEEKKVRSLKSTIIIGEKFFPDKKIAIGIFSTNDKTAGREVEEILSLRREDLPPPFFMADGLGANNLKDVNITYHFGACMAHARRKFWTIQEFFPDLCKRVLKSFTKIYCFEKYATEKGLSVEQRHKLRRIHSRSVLRALKKWFESAEKNKFFEPNSRFGDAVAYFNKYYDRLLKYTEIPSAPIDNNIAERALKMVVLRRKVSMFFKTMHGAEICDILTSLIYNCSQNGVPVFEYLRKALENQEDVKNNPEKWLPWDFSSESAEDHKVVSRIVSSLRDDA